MSRTKSTTPARPRTSRSKATAKAEPAAPQTEAPQAETQAPEQAPVVLTGRLCATPSLRHTITSGKPVTSFRLAVNDGDETSFHTVVVWGRQAEVVCEFLKKGRLVEVTGRTQERSYQAEDGERTVTEIVARHVDFSPGRSSEAQADNERAAA